MIAAERETVVCSNDADALVHITSAQRRHVSKLRNDSRVTIVRTWLDQDGGEWVEATIAADQWSPVSGIKRRTSDAQRQVLAAARAKSSVRRTGVVGRAEPGAAMALDLPEVAADSLAHGGSRGIWAPGGVA